jgi:DNA polymerase-4
VVPTEEAISYLHPLPVTALWGVGDKTAAQLDRLGLRTVADLAHLPVDTLCRAIGPASGQHLHDLAWGRDPRRVTPMQQEKSIGAEETFGADVDDPEVVLRELLRLSERTARRARRAGLAGRTVVLKVRFSDFTTITRSRTMADATDVGQQIYAAARALWETLRLQRARIRLVGVRLEGLAPAAEQSRQLILGERGTGWREAEQAADRAASRFGPSSVLPANLLGPPRSRP